MQELQKKIDTFNKKLLEKDIDTHAVIMGKIPIVVGILAFISVLVLAYYGVVKHVSDLHDDTVGLAEAMWGASIMYFVGKKYIKLLEYSGMWVIPFGIVVSPLCFIALLRAEHCFDNIGVASSIFMTPIMVVGIIFGGMTVLLIIFFPFVAAKIATIKAVQCTAKMTAKVAKGMGASDDMADTVGAVVGVAAGAAISAEIGSVVRDSIHSVPTVDSYTDVSSIDAGSIGNVATTVALDATVIGIDSAENDIAGADSDMTSTIESGDSVINFADSMGQADGTAVVHADDSVDLLDSNMQSAGHITDGGMILNSLNLPDGRIEGNNIFDAQNQLAYTIEGDTIYNKLHQVAFIIRDGNVYGNTNQLLSKII